MSFKLIIMLSISIFMLSCNTQSKKMGNDTASNTKDSAKRAVASILENNTLECSPPYYSYYNNDSSKLDIDYSLKVTMADMSFFTVGKIKENKYSEVVIQENVSVSPESVTNLYSSLFGQEVSGHSGAEVAKHSTFEVIGKYKVKDRVYQFLTDPNSAVSYIYSDSKINITESSLLDKESYKLKDTVFEYRDIRNKINKALKKCKDQLNSCANSYDCRATVRI